MLPVPRLLLYVGRRHEVALGRDVGISAVVAERPSL
jgi:hypothetical protein